MQTCKILPVVIAHGIPLALSIELNSESGRARNFYIPCSITLFACMGIVNGAGSPSTARRLFFYEGSIINALTRYCDFSRVGSRAVTVQYLPCSTARPKPVPHAHITFLLAEQDCQCCWTIFPPVSKICRKRRVLLPSTGCCAVVVLR